MSNETKEGIYSVKDMSTGKTLLLGLQHMFAMFGATVLVPILTGLDVATTLLFAGLGTLLFHLITKRKVPAFLGSSFAFLSGYAAVKCMEGIMDANGNTIENAELLPYACIGVCFAGLLYFILAAFIKAFGIKKVMRCFPPVVTGPIIIAIGLTLSASAVTNCSTNWWLAIVTILVVVICNIYGKGMVKIIPILIAVVVSYLLAAVTGNVDFSGIRDAAWIGFPIKYENTVFSVFGDNFNPSFFITSIVTIMPIALATIVEHIGDISAISSTTGRNYFKDPGLHRTLVGDGAATIVASLFGAPANTTYGENTGVLALTKVYDPKVMRIAAVFAIALACIPKVAFVIECIPAATIGGISFILYGMISAIGIRNVVENHVDFTRSRNTIIAALILVCALGFNSLGGITFHVLGASFTLSGLAIASIVGIIANAVLPGNEYEFKEDVNEENDKFQTYKL